MRLIALCLIAILATAATFNPATPGRTDVQNAINSTVDGDTVIIPAGRSNWATGITITNAITLQGAGTNSTIITGGGLISWTTPNNGFRCVLADIQFTNGSGSSPAGSIFILGASTNVVLTNLAIYNLALETIYWQGPLGVCTRIHWQLDGSSGRGIVFGHESFFGGVHGDGSWETALDWGGRRAIYIENCIARKDVASHYSFCDTFGGLGGGRLVIRHSYFYNLHISNHGTESSQRTRGGRSFEIYSNILTNPPPSFQAAVVMRSGTAIIASNQFDGSWDYFLKGESYRSEDGFPPWGSADGTKYWDIADVTDGAGTPGGAGDGVFDSGTASSGGPNTITDSGKSWTVNQWANYNARQEVPFTATSGGVRSAVVSGAGWPVNCWADWEFTKVSDNTKGDVTSNTSDTLTLNTSYYAVDMTGGGAFILSRAGIITANSSTALTVAPSIEGVAFVFTNQPYTIRLLDAALDDPGRGTSLPFTGNITTPPHQDIEQTFDPIHYWENTKNGGAISVLIPWVNIKAGRNYTNVARSGWVPLTYPHPLLGQTNPLQTIPTTTLSGSLTISGGVTIR